MFRSVNELEAAIIRFVAENNDQPKPFVWTANPKRILAAVKRWKEKLESIPVARTRHAAEKIVAKLRQVDVLMAQGRQVADAVRAKGVTEVT